MNGRPDARIMRGQVTRKPSRSNDRRPRRLVRLGTLTALASAGLVPSLAHASPWTLRAGQLVLSAGFNHQTASEEYLDSGPSQAFPLQGQLNASSFSVGLRAGFTDRIEFEAIIPVSVVNYDSDPVVLLDQPDGSPVSALDYYQRNVIDLSRSVAGVSDFIVAGRYGWLRAPVALATEVRIKAPTGYEPPAGTFGVQPTSREEFVREIRRFVTPENVEDDVTLGDGQLDIAASLLAGYAAPGGTFIRLGVGYNFRTGEAGDQLLGDLRIGQVLGKRALVYIGIRGAYTVASGRRIGVSVAAVDPTLPASEYGGTTNLLLREVTLDRDAVDVGGGFIIRMSERLELNAGYERTVWGRNTSAINSFSVSLAFRAEMGRSP